MNLSDVTIFDLGLSDRILVYFTLVCSAISALSAAASTIRLIPDFRRKKDEFKRQQSRIFLEMNYEHKLQCYSELLKLSLEYSTGSAVNELSLRLVDLLMQTEMLCDKETLPFVKELSDALAKYKTEQYEATKDKFFIAYHKCLDAFRNEINAPYEKPQNSKRKKRQKQKEKK